MPPAPPLSWQRLQEIRTKADRFWYGMNSKLILELLAHIQTLDLALQSLTPGGSEYVNNPQRCVALVKEQKLQLHRAKCILAKLGKLGDLRDPQADTSDNDPLT